MKKYLITLVLALLSVGTFAQTKSGQTRQKAIVTAQPKIVVIKDTVYEHKIDSLLTEIDTLIQINNELLEQIEIDHSLKNRYKLYPTENIYTLLELDTKTGQIKQVQWGLNDTAEGTWSINDDDLTFGYGRGSGTFELYPTKNMYQFILIDKTNGRKWHIQWGIGDKKRWIRRIY